MTFADLRALARAYIASPEPGTSGTPEPKARGPDNGVVRAEEIREFQRSGTLGTPGARDLGDAAVVRTNDQTRIRPAPTDAIPERLSDEAADGPAFAAAAAPLIRPGVIPRTIDMVEALAEAMAAKPGHRVADPEKAMVYFRAEACRRLSIAVDLSARGLQIGGAQRYHSGPRGAS